MLAAVEDVVGVGEVAQLFGVSRQRVYQLSREDGWPEGKKLGVGWVWMRSEVVEWAERTGRLPRED